MQAYDRISKYKSALMGMSILIVVYGHLLYYHSGLQPYEKLNITEWYTLGSVDNFLFLSGFGIFYSLRKNSDSLLFIQRRLSRLLPSYLPFIVIYCLFFLAIHELTVWQAFGNITTFGWWTQIGGQFNWYIPAQIAFYLFSPLFFMIINKYGRKSLFMIPLFYVLQAACVKTPLMIGMTRLPIYYLGMFLGSEAAGGNQPGKRHLTLAGVATAVSMVIFYFLVTRKPGWLSSYGFWWHPWFFATPGFLYLFSWIMEKIDHISVLSWINRLLGFLGNRSFEIYLWHLMIYMVGHAYGLHGWPVWILLALCGIVVGIAYHAVVTFLTGKLQKA